MSGDLFIASLRSKWVTCYLIKYSQPGKEERRKYYAVFYHTAHIGECIIDWETLRRASRGRAVIFGQRVQWEEKQSPALPTN